MGDGTGAALTVDNAADRKSDVRERVEISVVAVSVTKNNEQVAHDVSLADGDTSPTLTGAVTMDG